MIRTCSPLAFPACSATAGGARSTRERPGVSCAGAVLSTCAQPILSPSSRLTAAVVLLGAGGRASAADEWFVLGEQPIKAVDQGVEIKSQGGRMQKDVTQVQLRVDGADVELKKVVLPWANRADDILTNLGILKAGGSTPSQDAPVARAGSRR
jgi:hypothetical protein